MTDEAGDLDRTLDWLVDPALARLARRLDRVAGLVATETAAVLDATKVALRDTLRRKVNRVLVLELNAARMTGRLTAPDPRGRWTEFVDTAAREEFWHGLHGRYPGLVDRLRVVVDNRCAAAGTFAERFAADRDDLRTLLDAEPGELRKADIGAGDSHRGGHAVTAVHCAGGTVMYKPRPTAVDARLAELLTALTGADPAHTRIRVPRVLVRDSYGWAEHVTHRHCTDDTELRAFYRGLGHWLAVMRLVAGTDLHAENIIAAGPVPVVVDCESVFTPRRPFPPTGAGEATDIAAELLNGTVLRTGLLPGRGAGLAWRGVDGSGMGMLPGEQPAIGLPELEGAGTDTARIVIRPQPLSPTENLPSPRPQLHRYWGEVLTGFEEMADRITALDHAGRLEPLLSRFADCVVRVVVRDSEAYAELARMLWHPTGLHDPAAAEAKAVTLLAKHSANTRGPAGHEVYTAEVADLWAGDIPVFTSTPAEGWLHTPAGTVCGPRADQVALALDRWRAGDLDLERRVTRAALVSAYLNQGAEPDLHRMDPAEPDTRDLDTRRRALAAGLVRELGTHAVRGGDGTVTWFAPVLARSGWQTTPLPPDLYGGTLGVALLLAGYQAEATAGRADEVPEVARLLDGTLATARRTQRYWVDQGKATRRRPDPVGGYIGLGSQIWCWLTLERLGHDTLAEALELAEQVPAALEASEAPDIVTGTAGVIVPLLALAHRTGDDRWTDLATRAGDRLAAEALRPTPGHACWPVLNWRDGIGGFGHGATGIAWALARLAETTGDTRHDNLVDAALAYEETWYDPRQGGWRDPRDPDSLVAAWCHGAVGVGLAAADLHARGRIEEGLLTRAVEATRRGGFRWTHTLCHGDMGAWELLATTDDRTDLTTKVVTSLERDGLTTGLARDVYSPSMLSGSGGVAYQLLRMHPDCGLPSLLLPGAGEAR
ncbi:MAG: type 2 lanthipeptide synthetase LanM family protein [Actinomycetota bacterium]|nr:type 2 lanthipeptide synthetase LanM family protein [Actinomycetota bacterium]